MSEKKQMVDFPHYDPDSHVPFPPSGGEASTAAPPKRDHSQPAHGKGATPYHQDYDPDPVTVDPSQTTPGAPDIRDPGTKLPPDTDLSKLSPNVDLKDKY